VGPSPLYPERFFSTVGDFRIEGGWGPSQRTGGLSIMALHVHRSNFKLKGTHKVHPHPLETRLIKHVEKTKRASSKRSAEKTGPKANYSRKRPIRITGVYHSGEP